MKVKILDIIYCGIFATITAILSQIAIPMPGGVPLTLQTFAVSLVGILLGSRKGFLSMSVYVLMGLIGLPVFSGFSAGVGAIVGPTGGFILSFPIMSFIIGLVCERTDNKILIFLGMLLASIPNYLVGAIQFSLVTPFIFVGRIKAVLATIVGSMLRNHKSIKGFISYDKV